MTVIQFMFLGISMFWAPLRAHFNPCLPARAKMSLSRAQNIFIPVNINSTVLIARFLWAVWDKYHLVTFQTFHKTHEPLNFEISLMYYTLYCTRVVSSCSKFMP